MKNIVTILFLFSFLGLQAQNFDKSLLIDTWKSISNYGKNESEKYVIYFKFDNSHLVIVNDYLRDSVSYNFKNDKVVISYPERTEAWSIKKLDSLQLVLIDESENIIKLERTKEILPYIESDKKRRSYFAPPPPPLSPPSISKTEILDNSNDDSEDEVFNIVEELPIFPGCDHIKDKTELRNCSNANLIKFLSKNIKYPEEARLLGYEGSVYVRFIVEKDGSVTNIESLKDNSPGGGLKDAALNAIRAMNTMNSKWSPGKQGGKPVRVQMLIPIKFSLDLYANPEYLIETKYKPSTETEKLLPGIWQIQSIQGKKVPFNDDLIIEFKKDNSLTQTSFEDIVASANWFINPDGRKIDIKAEDETKISTWGIESLSKKKLVIVDKKIGLIVLKRK